jgi:hypothetical protein
MTLAAAIAFAFGLFVGGVMGASVLALMVLRDMGTPKLEPFLEGSPVSVCGVGSAAAQGTSPRPLARRRDLVARLPLFAGWLARRRATPTRGIAHG